MIYLIWLALIPVALHLCYSFLKKLGMMDDEEDQSGFWCFTFFSVMAPWVTIPAISVIWGIYWLAESEERTAWMSCFDKFRNWVTKRYK